MREMHEMLGDLLLDVAQEWTKYAELEDGRQVRVSWHAEGDLEWFEVRDAPSEVLLGRFQAQITITPFTLPEIGPEDDGALRAELSETCPNCAPLAAGASSTRVDGTDDGPCATCGDELPQTYHDTEPEPSTWFLVMEGDLVQGGDGSWYEVIRNVPGTGPNVGLRVVTLDLGGLIDKTYNMRPGDAVQRRRGPASRAKQVLADAGLQPEEIQR